MGLVNFKSEDEPFIKKKKSLKEAYAHILESMGNSIYAINDNLSLSYDGLKSEKESNSLSSSSISEKLSKEINRVPKNYNSIPTLFEWKEGGTMVYLTGSFCNWTQFFIMSKKANDKFQLVLDLPKAIHQYKFKVDNHWKHSTKHPFITDPENNINNIIDTTNKVKYDLVKSITIPNDKEDFIYKKKHTEEAKNEPFGRYYPFKREMNMDAPAVPLTYSTEILNIDEKSYEDDSADDCFSHKLLNEMISENNSFKVLGIPPHESVSHLSFQRNESIKIHLITVCLTHRLRNKLISVVYYKPVKLNLV